LWIATLASSVLYACAHAPWSMWPLAFVATAPVCAVLLGHPRVPAGRAALAGALFGAAATWLTVGHWSWLAANEFFDGSVLRAASFVLGLPLLASGIALHYAVAFALLSRLAGSGAAVGVIGSAALWALAELTRTSLGYGNPWASFASALAGADELLSRFRVETPVANLVALGGPLAPAFVASAVGASLGLAWSARRHRTDRGRALAAGALVVVVGLLATRYDGSAPLRRANELPVLRVAIVQPGFGRSSLWESAGAAESLARHVSLSRSINAGPADLVVWPESSLPFLLDANEARRDEVRSLARSLGAAVLAGGTRSVRASGTSRIFNSAFLFPADGGMPLAYDKRLLLPFVEHVPWWAAPFLESRWQGAYSSGSSTGASHAALDLAASPDSFEVKGWSIAPLLCFEAIYPAVVAERVAAGADLLVNLSNDSWFDAGAGTEQHFALSRLAASETRRPLVRAATTGVSALVAESGLVSWRMPPRTSAVVVVDVPPPKRDSMFVRGGRTGFTLLVVLVAGGAVAAATIARRSQLRPRAGAG
jgi:apolipoprotein N-acyltransferase